MSFKSKPKSESKCIVCRTNPLMIRNQIIDMSIYVFVHCFPSARSPPPPDHRPAPEARRLPEGRAGAGGRAWAEAARLRQEAAAGQVQDRERAGERPTQHACLTSLQPPPTPSHCPSGGVFTLIKNDWCCYLPSGFRAFQERIRCSGTHKTRVNRTPLSLIWAPGKCHIIYFFCKQFKLGSVSSNESRICSAGHRNYPGAAGYLPLLPRQVLTALCHGTLLWGRQDRAWNSSWHELYTWHRVCSQKGKTLFVTWSYTNNNKLTKSMNYVYARRYICICPITL